MEKCYLNSIVFGEEGALPIPTSATAATEPTAASASTSAHALFIAEILSLSTVKPLTRPPKILILVPLPSSGVCSSVLHAGKHGRHSRCVHLTWVETRCHHLLHHSLHLGRDAIYSWHIRHGTSGARSAHPGHSSHHHHLHVLHHLLVVLGNCVRAKLASDIVLLGSIQSPCKFVETVVEVVAQIGARFPPGFIIVR